MKKNWFNKNIFGFCLASFFGDWCHEMTTAILPLFIAQITGSHYAPMIMGIIQGAADAMSTIAKLFSGWLADRVSFYKPFLIIGYLLVGISLALIGTTSSIILIFIYKSIAWFARGLREPMRDAWIANIVPSSLYGRAFGIHRAFDTLGALIGPVCTFFLLKMHYSLPSIFYIALIPGIFAPLAIIVFTTETKQNVFNKEQMRIFSKDIKALPSSFIVFVLIMFLFGVVNFNPVLLIYRAQLALGHDQSVVVATTRSILLYVFFNSIRALSEFGIGTISDYCDRKKLLAFFGFGFFGITCIGCMYPTSQIWFWLCIFGCAGLSAGTVKALEKAHASYILPHSIRGTGLGILQSMDGIGDLIASAMIGFMWSQGYIAIGFGGSALISVLAMFLLLIKK